MILLELQNDTVTSLKPFDDAYFHRVSHGTTFDLDKAKEALGLFLLMDYKAFGAMEFKNIPKELFPQIQQTNILKVNVKLNNTNFQGGGTDSLMSSDCFVLDYNYCGTPTYDCCIPKCDNCGTRCFTGSETVCLGSGGSGNGGNDGGGGGGGGYGDGYDPPDCGGRWYREKDCNGGGGIGGGVDTSITNEDDGSNYVYDSISNACLKSLLNKMQNKSFGANYFRQLYSIFDNSTQFSVVFKDLDSASYNDPTSYGYCEAPDTLSNGHIFYDIALNRDVLIKCSKEWVAMVYLHELIHAYLGTQNYDFGSNSQHQAMALNYLTKMATTITKLFPSVSLQDAYCMAFYSLTLVEKKPLDAPVVMSLMTIWKQKIQNLYPVLAPLDVAGINTIGEKYTEKGTAGIRMTNCN